MSTLDIAQKAQNSLPTNVVNSISCEYDAGVLVLRGLSGSFYEKQIAQEAVKRIDGVTRVINRIEVVPKTTEPLQEIP